MFEDPEKTKQVFSICDYFLLVELYDYFVITSEEEFKMEFEDFASGIEDSGVFVYGGILFYANIKEDFNNIPDEVPIEEEGLYAYRVAVTTIVKDVYIDGEYSDQLVSFDNINIFDVFMQYSDDNALATWVEEQIVSEHYTLVTPNNFIANINLN